MWGTARATARSRSTAASVAAARRRGARRARRPAGAARRLGWAAALVSMPHHSGLRLNDGVCDDRGRFWVGSMRIDETPHEAALYRYDGGELVTVLTGVSLSNGIGWSPDRTLMYYVDSPTQRIDVFDYAARRRTGGRSSRSTLPRGRRTASRSTTTAVSGSRCGAAPPSAATTLRAARRDDRGRGRAGYRELLRRPGRAHDVHHTAAPDGRVYVFDAGRLGTGGVAVPAARRPPTPSRRGAVAGEDADVGGSGGGRPSASRAASSSSASSTSNVPRVDVDRDHVSVPHGGERPAPRRLRRDVPDHQPAGRAREAPVGDERDRLAEPRADDGRRDAEHLAHPGPAGRALVPDTSTSPACTPPSAPRRRTPPRSRRRAPGRRWRAPRCARELDDAPVRREVAAQACRAPRGLIRRADAGRRPPRPARAPRSRRRERPPVDRRRSPSTSPPRISSRDERRRAPGAMEVLGGAAARRREACDHRHALARPPSSSSSVSSTPASRAIASRCRIPFVEPPVATMPAIAFSSAVRPRNARAEAPRERDGEPPARAAAAPFVRRSSAGACRRRGRRCRGSRARPPSCSP